MKQEYITNYPSQTKKVGEVLAKKIKETKVKKNYAKIIALVGDLGGGKTTFLQGFAKGMGIKKNILSPTFIILTRYKIPRRKTSTLRGRQNTQYETLYHIDCYRIQSVREISNLGFQKIISDSRNIVAVEWADRIRKIIPKDAIWVQLEFINKRSRKIKIRKIA